MTTVQMSSPLRAQFDKVAEVLATNAARSRAHYLLTKGGLNVEVDDLLATVAEKVCRQLLERGAIGDGKPNAIRRYVFTVIRHEVVNLLKARKRDLVVEHFEDWGDPDGFGSERPALAVPDPNDVDGLSYDDARLVAQLNSSPVHPWLTAAVLAHLVVDEDPDVPLPDRIVRPAHPVGAREADWVALQYAGRSACFEQPDTPTVRKRRSTGAKNVRAALGRVLNDAWSLT